MDLLLEPEASSFVSREAELEDLFKYLDKSLAGKGQICFVTGEPGQGKSSLVTEFTRQAKLKYPDLEAAFGLCDPQTGQADPFLPFREIMKGLLGYEDEAELDTKAKQKDTNFVKQSTQALIDWGPTLVDVLVPGSFLISKGGAYLADKTGVAEKLAQRFGRKKKKDKPQVNQNQMFQQTVNVLEQLSKTSPLILVLDDAQWADHSSLDLLFYLLRRIQKMRILLLVTYREAEVAIGRQGERHPLEKVTAEVKRYYGDVTLDLMQADGEAFVEAYLDLEANNLEPSFRRALLERTNGHPLFVVELLRDMQERGDLIQNDAGQWITTSSLDWRQLPGRAEGVIAERIQRLPQNLRTVLDTASVQGDDFWVEVVADLTQQDTRQLLRSMNKELIERHKLIQDMGSQSIAEERFALYRFHNKLFRDYVYNHLSENEKRYLHEDIANKLEAIYADDVSDIAVELAWHYKEAKVLTKAREYLVIAGQSAAASYAFSEAEQYLKEAVTLTSEQDLNEQFELYLNLEEVYHWSGRREDQISVLEQLRQLAELSEKPEFQADFAARQIRLKLFTYQYDDVLSLTEIALDLEKSRNNPSRHSRVWSYHGQVLLRLFGKFDDAEKAMKQSLRLAQEAKDEQSIADQMSGLVQIASRRGDSKKLKQLFKQTLPLFQALNDQRGEARLYQELFFNAYQQNNLEKMLVYSDKTLELMRFAGDVQGESTQLSNILQTYFDFGMNQKVVSMIERVLILATETHDDHGKTVAYLFWGLTQERLGLSAESIKTIHKAIEVSKNLSYPIAEVEAQLGLCLIYVSQENYSEAQLAYEQLEALVQKYEGELPTFYEAALLAGLSYTEVKHNQSAIKAENLNKLLIVTSHDMSSREDTVCSRRTLLYTAYLVLTSLQDPNAKKVLLAAYQELAELSKNLDQNYKASFLKHIPEHKAILEAIKLEFGANIPKERVDLKKLYPKLEEKEPEQEEAISKEEINRTEEAISVEGVDSKEKAKIPEEVNRKGETTRVEPKPEQPEVPTQVTHEASPQAFTLPAQERKTLEFQAQELEHTITKPAHPASVDLRGASLVAAVLTGKNLSAWCLAGANLQSADLRASDLSYADLQGADLSNADLRACNLTQANLAGADLSNAKLQAAKLQQVIYDKQTKWPEDMLDN